MLAAHESIQERLVKEIEDYTNKIGSNRVFTTEDMKALSFLDAVVFEALRLFPPVAFDPKQATVQDVLPNGVVVPKGTIVAYAPLYDSFFFYFSFDYNFV